MSPRRLPPALLALTPGDLMPEGATALLAGVRAAVRAGLCGVLVREPLLSDQACLRLARAVRELLPASASGWVGLHDRAHLAAGCAADAVHLGGRSLLPAEVRSWLPSHVALGLSTHADEDPTGWEGSDYILHGPVFGVPGKGPAIGLGGLERAVGACEVPVWALGGIAPDTVGEVLAAGVRGVAVLRGILRSSDPAGSTRAYLRALDA